MPISQEIPTYRQLNSKGFFAPNDELIEEGVAFEFEGEPNADMEPLNEAAGERLREFFKKCDDGAREVATKAGRAYVPGVQPVDVQVALATQDARRIMLREGDGGIPVMRARKDNSSVRKVALDIEEPVLQRRVGRPRKVA